MGLILGENSEGSVRRIPGAPIADGNLTRKEPQLIMGDDMEKHGFAQYTQKASRKGMKSLPFLLEAV